MRAIDASLAGTASTTVHLLYPGDPRALSGRRRGPTFARGLASTASSDRISPNAGRQRTARPLFQIAGSFVQPYNAPSDRHMSMQTSTHVNTQTKTTTPLSFLAAAFMACAMLLVGSAAVAATDTRTPVILVVGDSISAGYGLATDTGWTTLLQQRLVSEHFPHKVVNASISGDTTAGGRSRLDALLARHHPSITIIELGGNDGLRGGSVAAMRSNLDAMTTAAQKAGSRVLLVGMRLPPNYGPGYTRDFSAAFDEVARSHKAVLVPFFFEGFAEDTSLFQPDRIHPTVAAQVKLLDNVWPKLQTLLGRPVTAAAPTS